MPLSGGQFYWWTKPETNFITYVSSTPLHERDLYVCDFIRVCILYVDISYTLVTHTNKTDHQAMTDIISNYG
jgi:hypothetical protein